ncbi:MAG: FAD binding domain-containing protein [Nocardiopsaceae bacterium]|nr:FAD binding domain-containing protein [Nocardiopsaceae bacterium]
MVVEAVHVPDSLAEATAQAARGGHVMAGGTAVMPLVNYGIVPGPELVSLRRTGLAGIEVGDGTARIGATTTFSEVADSPGLSVFRPAVATIASPVIRNMATVGGNLLTDPPGDFATCLLALDATCEVAGAGGSRDVPVAEVIDSGLRPGELLTAVVVRLPAGANWFYRKVTRRRMNSGAIMTIAATVETAGGLVTTARIALGGLAPRPVRAASAERALAGRPLVPDVVMEAGEAARADVTPADDPFASAWYRNRVLPVHLRRALLG